MNMIKVSKSSAGKSATACSQFCCMVIASTVAVGAIIGCGSDRTVAPVAGKVLYRGKPLEFGTVMFRLKDGVKISRGAIQSDGTFQMGASQAGSGAGIGLNLVRITSYEGQRPNAKSSDPDAAVLGKLLIPQKYTEFDTSGFTVDVRPGKNDPVVFELTDK